MTRAKQRVTLTHIEACIRSRRGNANAPRLREKERLEEDTEFVTFPQLLAMVPGLEMKQAQRLARNAGQFAEGVSSLSLDESNIGRALESPVAPSNLAPSPGHETKPDVIDTPRPSEPDQPSAVASLAEHVKVELPLPLTPVYPSTRDHETQRIFDEGFKDLSARLGRLEQLLAGIVTESQKEKAESQTSVGAERSSTRWLSGCADHHHYAGGEEVVLRTKNGKVVESS
jgi:hypothetical protein